MPERLPNKTQDPQSEAASDFKLLFPGCFSDGCIDPVKIANQTGLSVVGSGIEKERFGLIWAGKNDAIRALQEPSFATLIPEIEHSIEWESSKNVFIEGDNLSLIHI